MASDASKKSIRWSHVQYRLDTSERNEILQLRLKPTIFFVVETKADDHLLVETKADDAFFGVS